MNKLITGLLGRAGKCKVFKQAKKGQKSFRVTQSLLKKIWIDSDKVQNKGELIITIPSEKKGYNYILTAQLTKEKE